MNTEYFSVFSQFKEKLLEEAQAAREFADSYRDYKVGSAALCWNPKTKEYQIFRGCNMKPVNPGEKMCAERVAVGTALAYGCENIIAIAVVGEPQEPTFRTLHPCINCMGFLQTVHGCTKDTIVYTAWNDVEEMFTIEAYIQKNRVLSPISN